ncbi:MarR family transcriptional regulator [Amycolatopsis sp. NBRC 101858]|uniref:MarR family winged helix-turn-helix transcriptional regulator n=1 Tax=Amycolatopsis sp. NBRC 101858 TaxID=3032200 RepID=UPI00249FE9A3|nr:MarR family winged helix-turn-helix transcriptional regulator [Amycolatopsis sp. NBRC 101858]GLY42827.1 MarR family transcriptional regulator [Amycolatopsis sp. NBRC 101858]
MPCAEPGADVDALTDALLTASRLMVAVSGRSISAVENSLTPPQFRLLVVLDRHGPLRHADLAGFLGVTPSATSRMVGRMVAAGFVDRRRSSASRREIVLELNHDGARLVRRSTTRRRREIARIVTKMPEEHRHRLVEALTAFTQAGSEHPVDGDTGAIWG